MGAFTSRSRDRQSLGRRSTSWGSAHCTRTRLKVSSPIFKRGMKGVYQHCGEEHLHRYLAEFDFRYSNRAKLGVDDASARRALKGISGKRLTYRRIGAQKPEKGMNGLDTASERV